MKTIGFRVDAGGKIGIGHLKRSLVFANQLDQEVIFLSKSNLGNIGYPVINVDDSSLTNAISSYEINTLVFDCKHKVSSAVIEKCKLLGTKTILIDNTGSGLRNADIVIYPNAHTNPKYFNNVKGKLMGGWYYVFINEKFFGNRLSYPIEKKLEILVTMGGSDINNVTQKVINALEKSKLEFQCSVVIGPSFKGKEIMTKDKRFSILKNVDNMPELMLNHNLGIILFGVSAYEATAARLPSIVITDSKHLKDLSRMAEFKTIVGLGKFNEKKLLNKLELLAKDYSLRKILMDNCLSVFQHRMVRKEIAEVYTDGNKKK